MRALFSSNRTNWTRVVIAIALLAFVALVLKFFFGSTSNPTPSLPPPASAEFHAPKRTPDLSGTVADNLATMPAPAGAAQAQAQAPKPQPLALDDPIMLNLARYGTPVSKQALPVGGLTAWTVVGKSGNSVQLYTTADGKAVMVGTVWDIATGENLSDLHATTAPAAGNVPPAIAAAAATMPQVQAPAPTMPKSNLVSGKGALPAAFDGPTPKDIPEAIKVVDTLAGYTEGKGGPGDTLYIIIDPRCPYCRRAYAQTREYVKNGATIKWIPTVALGDAANGTPLATTVLRSKDPAVLQRLLGGHENIGTAPTPKEAEDLKRNLDFMFDAFRQNNEPQPGVPVAFFIDRRSGKPRMMMGLSEQPVLEDILGQPNKTR